MVFCPLWTIPVIVYLYLPRCCGFEMEYQDLLLYIHIYDIYIFCTYIPNDTHIRVLRTSFHFRAFPGNTEMAFQVLSWQVSTHVPSVMYLSVELTH